MITKRDSVSKILTDARHMLNISGDDPAIVEALVAVNFDSSRLEPGTALYTKADTDAVAFTDAVALQKEAKVIYDDAFKDAHTHYMKNYNVAKVVCAGNDNLLARLKLNETRERVYDKWLSQATAFYEDIVKVNSVMDGLVAWGITPGFSRGCVAIRYR